MADTSRPRLRRLMHRLVVLGFAVGRALGDYARGILDAGPGATAEARAGFDMGAVLAMLRRGVGLANALCARLQAEEIAAGIRRNLAPPVPAEVPRVRRPVPATHRAREGAAPWRTADDAEFAAAIAGRPMADVVAQICRDVLTPATLLGNARLMRAVGRVVGELAVLFGTTATAGLAFSADAIMRVAGTACGAGTEPVAPGPPRPG